MNGIMCISLNKDSYLGIKSDKDNPDESKMELEENFRAYHSALSAVDDNIPS